MLGIDELQDTSFISNCKKINWNDSYIVYGQYRQNLHIHCVCLCVSRVCDHLLMCSYIVLWLNCFNELFLQYSVRMTALKMKHAP